MIRVVGAISHHAQPLADLLVATLALAVLAARPGEVNLVEVERALAVPVATSTEATTADRAAILPPGAMAMLVHLSTVTITATDPRVPLTAMLPAASTIATIVALVANVTAPMSAQLSPTSRKLTGPASRIGRRANPPCPAVDQASATASSIK
jgi:hypothetical protein